MTQPYRTVVRVRHIPLYAEVAVLLEHESVRRRCRGQGDAGLGRAGVALQTWARGRLARSARGGAPTYEDVEQELQAMLFEGTLATLPGFGPEAVAAAQHFLRTASRASTP
jgi:hypothetical protein